jgi:hypothetical protein
MLAGPVKFHFHWRKMWHIGFSLTVGLVIIFCRRNLETVQLS